MAPVLSQRPGVVHHLTADHASAVLSEIMEGRADPVQTGAFLSALRAKGVAPMTVDRRHILRNALLPIATIIGLQTGLLLSGAVLTEKVFAWPGVGRLAVDAIHNNDFTLLTGVIFLFAALYVVGSLAADLMYTIVDPRIRYN